MTKYTNLFLLTALIMLLGLNIQAQEKLTDKSSYKRFDGISDVDVLVFTYEDGYIDTIAVWREGLKDYPNKLIGLDMAELKFNSAVAAPVVIRPYLRWFNQRKTAEINAEFSFYPIDGRGYLDNRENSQIKTYSYQSELGYTWYFKNESLNRNSPVSVYSYGNVTYRATLPVQKERLWGIKGSLYHYANPYLTYVEDGPLLDIIWTQSFGIMGGIHKTVNKYIKYHMFDETKATRHRYTRSLDLDFIYAPFVGAYDKDHNRKSVPVAANFGGRIRGTLTHFKRDKLGSRIGYEVSYYPGLTENNFNLGLFYGIALTKP